MDIELDINDVPDVIWGAGCVLMNNPKESAVLKF